MCFLGLGPPSLVFVLDPGWGEVGIMKIRRLMIWSAHSSLTSPCCPLPFPQLAKQLTVIQQPALPLWLCDQTAGDGPWCWAQCPAVEAQPS